ncbi:MAG: Hsp33 family molecular chaperone HslO [Proteobacteria bacterium]|nr:Hsp33 family molecular chaperone HslO [Pseudomonadota bacterium]
MPFDIAPLGVRGRLVRLSDVSAEALTAHKLPEAAARVAAETLTLSALLGSALKLDGRMTVQTRSNGPLDLIASDYYGASADRPAGVRGYARVDEARAAPHGNAPKFADLAGTGSLGITIEPRVGGETYQGIVELSPDGIAASAQTYFEQSEQLPTAIKLAAAPVFEPGKPVAWRAGGIILQRTAEAAKSDDAKNDEWERLKMFIATVEDFELVDTALKAEDLLWRLFHEDEIRVLPFEPIGFRCDCSVDRIAGVLKDYTPEDRAKLADPDGVIRARCEFCGKGHEIHPQSLQK